MGRFPGRRRAGSSREIWRRHFEAEVDAISEWYGISLEDVLDLVAEKMSLGYVGDSVFDAVKADLETRSTRIVERS